MKLFIDLIDLCRITAAVDQKKKTRAGNVNSLSSMRHVRLGIGAREDKPVYKPSATHPACSCFFFSLQQHEFWIARFSQSESLTKDSLVC